jgi:hypothetical protein
MSDTRSFQPTEARTLDAERLDVYHLALELQAADQVGRLSRGPAGVLG